MSRSLRAMSHPIRKRSNLTNLVIVVPSSAESCFPLVFADSQQIFHDKELLKVRDSRSNQCSKDSVGGGQRSLTSLISQFRKKAGFPIKCFSPDNSMIILPAPT